MSKHTPGPWVLCFQDDEAEPSAGTVFAASQLVNGRIPSTNWDDAIAYSGRNHPNHEANARLIAAAPELLEALRLILTNSAPGAVNTLHPADEKRARAALAKANGEGSR